jgi:hypothetical protein
VVDTNHENSASLKEIWTIMDVSGPGI